MSISKNKQNKVQLTKFVSRNLFLRNSANELFDWINISKKSKITVDFRKIQSITRAFANQYLINKEKSKKIIIDKNVSPHVKNMFDLIEKAKPASQVVSVH
ncbi:hypothetical protein LCGC14_0957250 [marine sediment metagenome]|uniref:DUF4325 domain-containing protein n=1 Tax=marine sediment metagenome TaxID=412755 RepID=A0A0F9P1R2_9ZZZZ